MREFDGFTGVATLARQGWEGDRVRAQGNDVIGSDDASIVQAEAAGKIETTRQRAEVASRLGGRMSEAAVVVGAKLSQYDIGLLQSAGVNEAKFADQTILKSAPGTLDASLGLG
jgi:hypothetical protein